jgi:hypothetical protein
VNGSDCDAIDNQVMIVVEDYEWCSLVSLGICQLELEPVVDAVGQLLIGEIVGVVIVGKIGF